MDCPAQFSQPHPTHFFSWAALAAVGKPVQVHRAATQDAKAKLDPILADGWLQCLVEDGLVFTADKVRPAPYGSR